ncbi:DUF2491 family protein [Billgrantia sp. Q4P2]|uniref:DUF2491 family protein n=1 Tax=Billgrantia sp. Q4P2 TaxID=3463857 RepID=UPI0040571AA5
MLDAFKKLFASSSTTQPTSDATMGVDPLFKEVATREDLRGLRLDGRVKLDLLALAPHQDEMVFRWGSNDEYHHIAAIGHVDLGAGAHLCRFYLENDTFIQISVENGAVAEFKLFDIWQANHVSDKEFDSLINGHKSIGSTIPELGAKTAGLTVADTGKRFDFMRVWGASGSDWTPPVSMVETLLTHQSLTHRTISHYGMLYERSVGSGTMEYVFLSAENEVEDASFMLVTNLGIDLSPVDIDAI